MINGCGNCANYVWGDNKTPLPSECITCTTTYVPNGQHPTPSHWKAKPQTNADRIRAMNDEELAHELALIAGWDRKQYEKAKRIGIEKVMLDWLRKEQGEHHEVD